MTLYITQLISAATLALALAYLLCQYKGVEAYVIARNLPSFVLTGATLLLLYAYGWTILTASGILR